MVTFVEVRRSWLFILFSQFSVYAHSFTWS